jgi:hypothetical protein
MASIRPDGNIVTNKPGITAPDPSAIIDGSRVTDALLKLNDSLKALDDVVKAVELAGAPDYTPEFFTAVSDTTRLPVAGDFTSTPYSNAVIVFDSLEFGPNDANTIYQNDYTIEVTVNPGEIFSVPFTASPSNVDAIQQLELYITEDNPEFGVWWLSTQPGGLTLKQNSFTDRRGLGGRVSLESKLYYIKSSTAMEANAQIYGTYGEIVPTQPYWLNFAYTTGVGMFGENDSILPEIEVCPGTRSTVIYLQGDTTQYEVS